MNFHFDTKTLIICCTIHSFFNGQTTFELDSIWIKFPPQHLLYHSSQFGMQISEIRTLLGKNLTLHPLSLFTVTNLLASHFSAPLANWRWIATFIYRFTTKVSNTLNLSSCILAKFLFNFQVFSLTIRKLELDFIQIRWTYSNKW